MSLYEVGDVASAASAIARDATLAALTRGEKGSVVVSGDERRAVEAAPADAVDTTGAGDLYAAGFLYGYTRGVGLERAARIGRPVRRRGRRPSGRPPARRPAGPRRGKIGVGSPPTIRPPTTREESMAAIERAIAA